MSRRGTSASSTRSKVRTNSKAGSNSAARSIKTGAGTRAKTRGRSQVNHTRSSKPAAKKSWFGYVFVTLITFGVIFSDLMGPTKGWLRPAEKKEDVKPVEPKKEETKVEVKSKPKPKVVQKPKEVFKADIKKTLTAEEVEESDKEKLKLARYQELVNKYSAEITEPVFNKSVTIRMKDGRKIRCQVVKQQGRDLYLEKIEPYNGKMRVDATSLSDETKMLYFGPQFVKVRARKQVEREDSQGLFDKDPATETGFFDPKIESTPNDMIPAVREVGEWLKLQARRGSANAVMKVSGKTNSSNAKVLYLYLNRAFVTLTKEERVTWLEAVRQFWVLRCKSNGIASDANAHVCLVLDGRNIIIGGTKEEEASKIWFKKLRR